MAKIWVLQHHPAENLGAIADSLEEAALAWQYVRVFDGAPIPADMKGAGGLVVMGGPETVYKLDQFPYLRDEMRLIEDALRQNKPILGVCLGSQLLAATLGATVKRGESREIGWYPVRLSPGASDDRLLRGLPPEFVAAHWHSDVFELPSQAVALASSEKSPVQAFRFGDKAYGLLFHAEMTAEILEALVGEFRDGLKRVGIDGEAIAADAPKYLPPLNQIGATIFGRWAGPIQGT
ncbi:MAG TPA: gamma-glutamyl-gamma-aminobutyrate hydrolase family protein [Candidatus Binataceae bacterium]|nr:gamma-glutamyl-gamma-aminobutyrate hydrolase family protein [Candidatus Binataceae bacterium]